MIIVEKVTEFNIAPKALLFFEKTCPVVEIRLTAKLG